MTQSRKPLTESPGADSGEPTDLQSVARTNLAETQDCYNSTRFPKIDGYDVTAVLGRGGMGIVYRASDLKLKREVAIKMVLFSQFASAEQLDRFRSEAETVARLRHPSIVQIFDVGEHQGQPYLTFELIEGPSLARFASGVPQTPEFAAEMIEIVSRAVQYAHEKSVVHRDIKPGNILLEQTDRSSSGPLQARVGSSITRKSSSAGSSELKTRTTSGGLIPKISDFGLAKQLDADAEQTTTGQVLGTARYMAPEQAEGRSVGPAADVYSLGTILYELLAGRAPFHGATSVETLQMLRQDEPIALRRLQPRLPRDLETICMKCLEKDPQKRYASAEDLADDLRGFLRDEPITARPVGPMERGLKWARRRPAVAFLIGSLILVIGMAFLVVTWQWQKTLAAQRQGAKVQVDLLLHARPEAVPTVVRNLAPYRRWVDPALTSMLHQSDLPTHDRDRATLGLLPIDRGRLEYLSDRMNATDEPLDLVEFLVFRDALVPYRADVAPRHWKVLLDDSAPAAARLRTALALARFDPPSEGSSQERWSQVSSFVAEQFATQANQHPNQHATLADALYPLRTLLLPALVEQLHRGTLSDAQKSTTTSIVADFARDNPELLVDLAVVSDAPRHAMIQPKLSVHPLEAVGLLRDVLDQEPGPELTEPEKDSLARRRAIAAISLSHLDRSDLLWRSMRFHQQPRLRTYLIHMLAEYSIPVSLPAGRLEQEPDESVRRAILLSLGQYQVDELDTQFVTELTAALNTTYHQDPDPGIHSAIEWLMVRWRKSDLLQKDQGIASKSIGEKRWFRNSEGHVLAIIDGPVTFQMGSPPDEPGRRGEELHARRLGQSFAIATKEVSLEQFNRFVESNPPLEHSQEERYGPSAKGPAIGVSWIRAAMYCRWLSQLEGLPEEEMCYPPISEMDESAPHTISLPEDFMQRIGYRLPTEGEWEYACRAGTVTARSFGFAPELVDEYGRHLRNSSDRVWPGGMLKPNDVGLFDMYGNVWEWCQDWRRPYPKTVNGLPLDDGLLALDSPSKYRERIIRGGSITNRIEVLRSAQRDWYTPGRGRNHNVGFRVARTIRSGE